MIIEGFEIDVSGPYPKYENPYGTFSTCHRNEWYVKWFNGAKPFHSWRRKDDLYNCIAVIEQFQGQDNRYIIRYSLAPGTTQAVEAETLEAIIALAVGGNYTQL